MNVDVTHSFFAAARYSAHGAKLTAATAAKAEADKFEKYGVSKDGVYMHAAAIEPWGAWGAGFIALLVTLVTRWRHWRQATSNAVAAKGRSWAWGS